MTNLLLYLKMEKEEKPKKIEIPENTADLFTDEELQSFVRFFKILLEIADYP